MKITVNIECTPEEARQFFGLPDVRPLQEDMMKIMRDKTLETMKKMEPDNVMQMWGPLMSQGMNQGLGQMNEFFKNVMSGAAAGHNKKSKS